MVNAAVTCDTFSGISGSGKPTIVCVGLARFHTFTRCTCTIETRVYSAVTDSVGLYNKGCVNLFLACIRVHNVIRKWTL